jgi:hypothetical protein
MTISLREDCSPAVGVGQIPVRVSVLEMYLDLQKSLTRASRYDIMIMRLMISFPLSNRQTSGGFGLLPGRPCRLFFPRSLVS